MKGYRVLALVLVLVMLLSIAPLAGAQGGAFVATFDLPTTPTTEGELAGVDPSGQTVIYWHQHPGDREVALNEMVADFRMPPQDRHAGSSSPPRTLSRARSMGAVSPQDRHATRCNVPCTSTTSAGSEPAR